MSNLSELVANSQNIVVLTGAGISTESGIPDFRSPGGVWETFRIVEFQEFITSEEARLEDWRRRFFMEDQLADITPNIGHEVIAEWVKSGKCSTVITQNIDGLHQLAGTPDNSVIEIHGNARHANCLRCGLRHELTECSQIIESSGISPQCKECGGILKAAVVMFGQQMPTVELKAAKKSAKNCDLFIAIGTSLVVHPAKQLPIQAQRRGAKFVIINREKTDLDWKADLVIRGEIGEALVASLSNKLN